MGKDSWVVELASMDHEADDVDTTWNERCRKAQPERMSPRIAWKAIQKVMPKDAIISSDIGNNCAIGNAYPSFPAGRKYLSPGLYGPCGYGFPSIIGAKIGNPTVPVVGFRNGQWGAEKRNTTLWYKDNFVGTELNYGVQYAKIAEACGLKGVKVVTAADLEAALANAIEG